VRRERIFSANSPARAVRQHMADMTRGQPEADQQVKMMKDTNKIENASEYILCL
jgi:hypothetical protein